MNCKKCKKDIPNISLYCMFCGSPQKKNPKKKMYQRPDGLYEKAIIIDGKKKAFRGKTEKEVFTKILEFEGFQESGPLFKEVAETWKVETWDNFAYNTIKVYEPAMRESICFFGESRIKEIKTSDVQAFLYTYIEKKFAKKTVGNKLQVVRSILDHGVREGIIENNVADKVKIPSNLPKTKRAAPTEEEIEITISNKNKPFGLFPFFVLYTGCRLGEALAITGADINYKNKILTINKSMYFANNMPNIKQPKTLAGNREVPIPDILIKEIPRIGKEEYLFNDNGKMLTKSGYEKRWIKYRKEVGTEITPHQLRHGYATLLYEAGVAAKDAQTLLGHTNIAMTLDVYTHISEKQKNITIDKFNAFLNIKNTDNTQ